MLQTTKRADSAVSIIGAGIAGAWQALLFAQAGHSVTLHERGDADMTDSTSHWAGGMLAPWCEAEVAEPIISRLGQRSLDIWRRELPDTPFNGSLVVAHPRERNDFERFARMTEAHRRLDAAGLAELEPSLEGRFRDALFFPNEGHVEPRRVLPELHERIKAAGHTLHERAIVPDDVEAIRARVKGWIDAPAVDVIISTGGTGFTGRDVTPEAVEPLFEKKMDGFATLFLMVSHAKIGTSAIQTRATAGVAGATYIFCLPGSPGACRDAWDEILVHQLDYRYRPCNFVEIMPRLDEHLRRAKAKGATL